MAQFIDTKLYYEYLKVEGGAFPGQYARQFSRSRFDREARKVRE
jgi:hypothetical protein